MKQHFKKILTFFLFIISFLSIFNLTFVDVAGAYSTRTLTTWETFNFGANSGSNSYMSWERKSGTDFNIVDNTVEGITTYSNPKSLHMHYSTGGDDGYINLTQNYVYISYITFYFYIASGVNGANDNLRFIDSNGDFVLEIKIYYDGVNYLARYIDVGNVTQTFATLTGGGLHKVTITHSTGNTMNYSIWNGTGVFKGGKDGSTMISSDWENYDYIYMYNGGQESLFYLDDIIIAYGDTLPAEEGEGEEGYQSFCVSGDIIGDITLTSKHLDIKGAWGLSGQNWNTFKIKLQDYQMENYGDLLNYSAYAYANDLGNPSKWEYIDENYYYLVWDGFNISVTDILCIELECNYTVWYYQAINQYFEIREYDEDYLYGNGCNHYDGNLLGHSMSMCFGFGTPPESEYNITFSCAYSSINCMQTNNYLTIYTFINPMSNIYYILSNGTGVNVYEGAWSTGYTFINTIWVDQSYGIGHYTFSVWEYNKRHSGWNYATNYTICVEWGINRTNIVYTDKKIYYEGDSVNIYWNAPFGELDYIVIHDNPTQEDATTLYNTSVMGLDTLQTILNAWVSKITAPVDFQTFYLYMINSSTGLKISNVEYVFQVKKGLGTVGLYIDKTTLEQFENIRIYGKHPFSISSYDKPFLEIDCNGVWITTIDAPSSFDFSYQCLNTGTYKVCLMVSGHEYICRSWTVTPFTEKIPLLPKINDQIGYIVGIIIIVSFLLMPMLIALSYGKSPADIPAIVYAISGGIGIGLCVLLDLVPLWLPFFIIVIGVLIVVLVWLRGSSSG